jgi:hypothetical protein
MKIVRSIALASFVIALTAVAAYSRPTSLPGVDGSCYAADSFLARNGDPEIFDETTAELDIVSHYWHFTQGRMGVHCFDVKASGPKTDTAAKDLMAKYSISNEASFRHTDPKVISESPFTLGRYSGTTYTLAASESIITLSVGAYNKRGIALILEAETPALIEELRKGFDGFTFK